MMKSMELIHRVKELQMQQLGPEWCPIVNTSSVRNMNAKDISVAVLALITLYRFIRLPQSFLLSL
jgi:hypothetical protein